MSNTVVKANYRQQYEFITGENCKVVLMAAPIGSVLSLTEKMQRPLTEAQLLSQGIVIPNTRAYAELSCYLQQVLLLARTQPDCLTDSIEGKSLGQLIQKDALPLFIDVLTSDCNFLPEKKSPRRKLVKRAEEIMRDHFALPITLTDLCEKLKTSQRSLYYAFEESFGLPPMQYLKILRLHDVRRALKSADPQTSKVTTIAGGYGFWHMGQFSTDYRIMFGESPSTTLRKE